MALTINSAPTPEGDFGYMFGKAVRNSPNTKERSGTTQITITKRLQQLLCRHRYAQFLHFITLRPTGEQYCTKCGKIKEI